MSTTRELFNVITKVTAPGMVTCPEWFLYKLNYIENCSRNNMIQTKLPDLIILNTQFFAYLLHNYRQVNMNEEKVKM